MSDIKPLNAFYVFELSSENKLEAMFCIVYLNISCHFVIRPVFTFIDIIFDMFDMLH